MKYLFLLFFFPVWAFGTDKEGCEKIHKLTDNALKTEVLRVHNELPDFLKKFVCKIKFKYSVKRRSLALQQFNQIIFRAGIFNETIAGLDINRLLTWKEQLSFGTKNKSFFQIDTSNVLVKLEYQNNRLPSKIEFTLLHELGHYLDQHSKLWKELHQEEVLQFQSSLASYGVPIQKPCFFACEPIDIIKPIAMPFYYRVAHDSLSSTLYSLIDADEHFADYFALYISHHYLGLNHYWIKLPNGTKYDLVEKLNSTLFERQHQYMTDFIKILQGVG